MEETRTTLLDFSLKDLKKLLKDNKLPVYGKKSVLVDRILENLDIEFESEPLSNKPNLYNIEICDSIDEKDFDNLIGNKDVNTGDLLRCLVKRKLNNKALQVLKRTKGTKAEEYLVRLAAKYGNLELIELFYGKNEVPEFLVSVARLGHEAKTGNIETLNWVRKNALNENTRKKYEEEYENDKFKIFFEKISGFDKFLLNFTTESLKIIYGDSSIFNVQIISDHIRSQIVDYIERSLILSEFHPTTKDVYQNLIKSDYWELFPLSDIFLWTNGLWEQEEFSEEYGKINENTYALFKKYALKVYRQLSKMGFYK